MDGGGKKERKAPEIAHDQLQGDGRLTKMVIVIPEARRSSLMLN